MHVELGPPQAPPAWVGLGCGIGVDDSRCGQPIVGAFAVTVAAGAWELDEQHPAVLLLCRPHYAALDAPPSEDPCPPSPPH